jgi:hypothetical protein
MATPPRALCLTGNPALRRTLKRTLQAAGSTVEFADSAAGLGDGAAPELLVMDPQTRRGVDLDSYGDRFTATNVVIVGESLAEEEVIGLLRGSGINHVISELSDPDEGELVVTSGKFLKRDIFGLEKYLAWGALVHEREVMTYDEKRDALFAVAEYAKDAGARRQVIGRIESVTDELLMNALYDAPAVRYGVRPRIAERSRQGLGPLGDEPAFLRFGCDGRYFAVSVRDNYGELRKDVILDHIARARTEKGRPMPDASQNGGAGLGLYFIVSSVTRFIANICPGQTTEVIGLFDLKATGREQDTCAKSLHIFTTPTAAP